MAGGFQHDIAGGSGELVVAQVQSPNYVHGVSGWIIRKDGTAEFHDIEIPAGSGGATIYFASTAPAGANTGDLWYDTAAGLELSQWNGSAWVAYQISTGAIAANAITTGLIAAGAVTATQIAANTITAAQLAAGIVYAGIVDATTITGATLIADGTSGEILVYSGTPAAGNLIGSWSGAAGTDSHGNAYPAGLKVYGTGSSAAAYVLLDPVYGRIVIQNELSGYQAICDGGSLSMATPSSASNPATIATQNSPLALIIESPSDGTDGAAEMKLYAGTSSVAPYVTSPYIVALNPSSGAAETWHSFAGSYQNGWTAFSGRDLCYRLEPDGTVHLTGRVNVPSGVGNPSTVATLPAGYRPANRPETVHAENIGSTGSFFNTYVEINTSGNVNVYGAPGGGSSVSIGGRFALDAPT